MNAVGFVVAMIVVSVLIHLYLWRRLVHDTLRSGRARRSRRPVAAIMILLAALAPATLLAAELPPRYERWLAWPGYLWLGVLFYLVMVLLLLEVPVLVAQLATRSRRRPTVPADPVPTGSVPAESISNGSDAAPANRSTVPAGHSPATDYAMTRPAATAGRAINAEVDSGPGSSATTAEPVPPPAPPATGGGEPAPGYEPGFDPGRRLLFRRAAAITAGLVAVGTTGYGVSRAYRPPTVQTVPVPLAGLDPRVAGLRVAVVADLHVGPLYGGEQVARVVETVNRLDADLVAVVGDMVSSEIGRVRRSAAPLRDLDSRYGTYAVTGNHEYYTGHEQWLEAADDLGIRVLRNERVEIVHRGGAVDLAGVNDRAGSSYDDPPDYAAALGGRDASRPVVLLAHQPVQVERGASYGVDLQLSGHTHGGQVFPFHLLVRAEQPAVSGLSMIDGTALYVTNGAGFWGPPLRVGADPEVSLIELVTP